MSYRLEFSFYLFLNHQEEVSFYGSRYECMLISVFLDISFLKNKQENPIVVRETL
jgi:hypothetical protein